MSDFASSILDDVLAPLDRVTFLTNYWGKQFVRLPGSSGKFAHLMPWKELNRILECHALQPPRIRLFQSGEAINAEFFTSADGSMRRLKTRDLVGCLADGATLIIDSINEFSPLVGDLNEAFEDAFWSKTNINLYAGWREERGFDLHWDPQDTLMLQVSGRKHWMIYAPTRMHPLKGDWGEPAKPDGDPVWDGLLEEGDAIYLPRGWWHVAVPMGEPTLHLTVTVVPPTGMDLLNWVGVQLARLHQDFRKNVPHRTNVAECKQFFEDFRETVLSMLNDEELLREFLVDWDATIPLRTRIELPSAPFRQRERLDANSYVRLATARRVIFKKAAQPDRVIFKAGHVSGECTKDFISAFEELSGTVPRNLNQVCEKLASEEIARKFKVLINVLATQGAISQDGSSATPQLPTDSDTQTF